MLRRSESGTKRSRTRGTLRRKSSRSKLIRRVAQARVKEEVKVAELA